MSNIDNWPAWKALLARVGRQVVQAVVVVLGLAQAGEIAGLDLGAWAVGVGTAAVVTVLTWVFGWVVDPAAPLWVQAVERALKALAGVLSALAGTDGLGLLAVHWDSAFWWATLSAVALAVLQTFTNPPAVAVLRRVATR